MDIEEVIRRLDSDIKDFVNDGEYEVANGLLYDLTRIKEGNEAILHCWVEHYSTV